MFDTILSQLMETQRSRPLSVGVVLAALFLPSFLTLQLAQPQLVRTLPAVSLLVLAGAISLPIVMICFGLWYTPISAAIRWELDRQTPARVMTICDSLREDDLLEWPCLFAGSWMATIVLFGISVAAYYEPIRIGATYILVAAILAGAWILILCATSAVYLIAQKRRAGKSQNQ